ncbi:sulfur carrier protein ThiS [Aeromonas sobria]|uniref:sulfur carrier protein ThiS n=1 Tax=Aeromonas sobria TaxID=646 RepID=UPI003CFC720D
MNIRLNDIELTLPTGQCLTELLAVQEIAPQGVAVALNGIVLPRSRWAETRLNDGDEIHLFTAIAGG